MTPWPFGELKPHHYGALLVDPPWHYKTWSEKGRDRCPDAKPFKGAPARHYETMSDDELMALPVIELAAENCVLFLWATWPKLPFALKLLGTWGFRYKTSAFDWMKADLRQPDLFKDQEGQMGNGYWTRSNTEPVLLATRGRPKRLNADVRQAIIEKRRAHSRKPDCVYSRIERLVTGPYAELWARSRREGWDSFGNETDKFGAVA